MKKYVLIGLTLMATTLLAENTAYTGIKLTGKTTAASTNAKIRITENADYSDAFESGADAEILSLSPSNSQSVFLYALVDGTHKCTSIYDNEILNLPLCFQTNREDDEYTLTFTSTKGRAMKLYDVVLDSVIAIEKDATYDFKVTAENCSGFAVGTNTLITDRFIIEPLLSFTRDLKTENVGTVCWPYAIAVSDITGATIWEPTLFNETSVAVAQVTDSLKAAVPYFFIATDYEQVFKYRPLGKVSEAGTNNGMHGAFEKIDVQRGNYIAYENGILCVGSGCYIVANRAYFVASECQPIQAPGRKVRWLNTPGASMGVEELNADVQTSEKKVLINGQFIILKNGRMFNAQGQEL